MKPVTLVLLAAMTGGCALLSGCTRSKAAPGSPPPPVTVAVARPETAAVQSMLEYTGRIEPAQRVEIRSRVSGYLQKIAFRDGQQVKVGDVLFVIDPLPFAVARDRALAVLAQAQARAKLAATGFARSDRLVQTGAVSAEEVERARGELEGAQAAMQLARAELRGAELELAFTSIRAPIAGTVSDRRADVGSYIAGASGPGAYLTTIVTPSPVRATVDLSEAHFRLLRGAGTPSARVELTVDDGTTLHADIDFVDNEVSARSGTVRVRASIANADRAIMPGSFVRVRLPVGITQERLLIPGTAIVHDQKNRLAFIVGRDGKVAARKLTLGERQDERQVVLSGLQPDDDVIVSGAARVRPGERVNVAPPAGAHANAAARPVPGKQAATLERAAGA